MRKLIVGILALALVLVGFQAIAHETKWNGFTVDIARSSVQTASASIATGRGLFYGIIVRTDGTNAVTLNVYDSGAANGTKLTPANLVINGASFVSGWSLGLDPAVTYTSGIYVSVSVAGGGACSYQVLYFPLQQ